MQKTDKNRHIELTNHFMVIFTGVVVCVYQVDGGEGVALNHFSPVRNPYNVRPIRLHVHHFNRSKVFSVNARLSQLAVSFQV